MRGCIVAVVVATLAWPGRGAGQSGPCGPQAMLSGCPAAYQALASGVPQFGIAAAGGAAVPGVEGTRGVTLGLIPHTSAALRLSAAAVQLPDLDHPGREGSATPLALRLATATQLGAGSARGTGALELLLEAGVVTASGEGGRTAATVGAGARLGLLRESFTTPGIALSGVLSHSGPFRYGEHCPPLADCIGADGEARFGVNDLSGRLTLGKRVGPLGLLVGAGWDRFASTLGSIAWLGSGGFEPVEGRASAAVHDARWSAFANLSRGLTVGSLVAEAGWMSGGHGVTNYDPAAGGYDPGRGTLFGSLALRVSL